MIKVSDTSNPETDLIWTPIEAEHSENGVYYGPLCKTQKAILPFLIPTEAIVRDLLCGLHRGHDKGGKQAYAPPSFPPSFRRVHHS